MKRIIREYYPLIVLLLFAGFLLFYKIDKPFYGYHDWNGVRYGQIARNYLRYGLVATRLGQVENGGVTIVQNFQYLTHYPPLLPLTIVATFAIFGISEVSARVVPALLSLGSLVFFFLLVKESFDRKTAILSTVLFAATPMFIYFGKLPTHEPLALFFSLSTTFFFFRWLKSRRRADFVFMFLALTLGEITGWAIYFILPLVTILILVWRRGEIAKILILWLSAILIFLLHLSHTYILTGSPFGGELLDVFLFRANIGSPAQLFPFTPIEFVFKQISYSIQFFSLTLLFLAGVWFLRFLTKVVGKMVTRQDSIIVFLLFFGLSYPLVFRNIAFVHDYILFYLLPFFAISAAEILISISNYLPRFLVPIFLLGVVLVVFFERFNFVQALWDSRADEPGYKLGLLLKEKTKPEDKILFLGRTFGFAHGRFVTFYADRDIIYSDTIPEELENFDWAVEQRNGSFKIGKAGIER